MRRPTLAVRAQATDAKAAVTTPFASVKSEAEFFGTMDALVKAGKVRRPRGPRRQGASRVRPAL